MITLEELVIQSLYYRLVVTRVVHSVELEASPIENDGAATTGTTAGCVIAAGGVTAAGGITVAGGVIAAGGVMANCTVDTILDTGHVRLLRKRMTSSETQTESLQVWCVEGSPAMTSSPLAMSRSASSDFSPPGGATQCDVPCVVKCLPSIDLTNLQTINIVQLQDLRSDERKTVMMYTKEPTGTGSGGGGVIDAIETPPLLAGMLPKIVTTGTCAAAGHAGNGGGGAAEPEMDSGIWDMLHGNSAAINALLHSPADSRESSPKVVDPRADASRTLTYKLYNVDETRAASETPVHECVHVVTSDASRRTLTRSALGGSVSSIQYEQQFDCDACARHACAVERRDGLAGALPSDVTSSRVTSASVAGRRPPDAPRHSSHRHLSPPAGLLDAMTSLGGGGGGGQSERPLTHTCARCRRQSLSASASSLYSNDGAVDLLDETAYLEGAEWGEGEGEEEPPHFQLHPDWMRDLPQKVRDMPLTEISIPGSHISLAIERHMRTDMDFTKCNYEMATFLRRLPDLAVFNDFRARMKRLWRAWMPKQWLDVGDQLRAGVRYLDVKICRYRSAFYGEHGLYTRQLATYLKQMRAFLDAHPSEVIILHFQPLDQLRTADKRRLVTMLFQSFGARLARAGPLRDVTLSSLAAGRKQALVILASVDIDDVTNHIFSALVWSDLLVQGGAARERSVAALVARLDASYGAQTEATAARAAGHMHVTRAVLYADMSMVFGDFECRSMQELARRDVTTAVDDWLIGKHLLNVVIVDFAGVGDVIGSVIRLNALKKTHTAV